ncbi:acyl-CoA dehydrogenase family protein, partial [Thermodesulfobacteriota bacterium]
MDFKLTKEQETLKKEFEDFFSAEMKNAPNELKKGGFDKMFATDETWNFHRYMAKKLAEKGWLVRAWPKKYGGEDASLIEQLLFNEVRTYHRAPGMDMWGIGMFAPTILLAGTDEQKERLLPPIARAEVHYCQGWSEPDAGSDLAAVQTTAIKKGDYYVLNGQKIWTTGAHRSDHMFLLARTDPSSQRNKGLSVFNLSFDTPGIEIRPIKFMNNEIVYNEIFFTDVKIPEYDRIGPEHQGWNLTRETMNFERSGIEMIAEATRHFEDLIEFVKTTKRNGKYLSEDPVIRHKLAQLHIDIELGRVLSYKIIWLQEKGGLIMAASAASESKLFGTEMIRRFTDTFLDIQGMYGQLENSKWALYFGSMVDLYQNATGYTIAAGSSEIQRNLIAWV